MVEKEEAAENPPPTQTHTTTLGTVCIFLELPVLSQPQRVLHLYKKNNKTQ
jgi:hypothetical protein